LSISCRNGSRAAALTTLDPVIDEAIGESSNLRYRSPVLQAAIDGLLLR
jgi:hypothetical protein